jgi:hypothetical protein
MHVPILLLLLASVAQAPPQPPPANSPVRVVVRDQTSAVLQGAEIDVTDESGGMLRRGTSDVRGEYTIEGLPSGVYADRRARAGFDPLFDRDIIGTLLRMLDASAARHRRSHAGRRRHGGGCVFSATLRL